MAPFRVTVTCDECGEELEYEVFSSAHLTKEFGGTQLRIHHDFTVGKHKCPEGRLLSGNTAELIVVARDSRGWKRRVNINMALVVRADGKLRPATRVEARKSMAIALESIPAGEERKIEVQIR